MTTPHRPKCRWVHVTNSDATQLRMARLGKGLTQAQLAVLCGRSQPSVCRVESGRTTKIPEGFAAAWARWTDLPPAWLFRGNSAIGEVLRTSD